MGYEFEYTAEQLENTIEYLSDEYAKLVKALNTTIIAQEAEINRLREYEYMYKSVSK